MAGKIKGFEKMWVLVGRLFLGCSLVDRWFFTAWDCGCRVLGELRKEEEGMVFL